MKPGPCCVAEELETLTESFDVELLPCDSEGLVKEEARVRLEAARGDPFSLGLPPPPPRE